MLSLLRLAEQYPDDVLEQGEHRGYLWLIMHNNQGFRCGYIALPEDHPWRGGKRNGKVHGGITFAEDNWIGFDCAHHGDAPDSSLPRKQSFLFEFCRTFLDDAPSEDGHVWTTDEVKRECIKLIEQAIRTNNGTAIPNTIKKQDCHGSSQDME